MNESTYLEELSKCVRCGTCKTFCPTYLNTLNEAMGARGRVAILGELGKKGLAPTKTLAEKIFSCMLCGACKNLCPTGIDIPEIIYKGRNELKSAFKRGRAVRSVLKHSISRLSTLSSMMKLCQRLFYNPLNKAGLVRYLPNIASKPFNQQAQVYRNMKKIGRVAIFAGCSVNYLYPKLGNALSSVLLAKGYEVVVFKGEECCGAPLRSMGLEKEAELLAQKNIEHFNKVRAEAIVSMCPTCTMVIKEQYPVLTGNTIANIMDINEFISENNIASGLVMKPSVITYHDPCHLSYGLGIRDKPRQILSSIKGVKLVEMKHADECCGFAGFFNVHYRDMSETIGKQKIKNISDTSAETVVTSCPGCIMQMETMQRNRSAKFNVKHIVEVIDEAMLE